MEIPKVNPARIAQPEADPWDVNGTAPDMVTNLVEAKNAQYDEPRIFSVGTLVTPMKDKGIKGRGRPMVVIDQRPVAYTMYEAGGMAIPTDVTLGVELSGGFFLFNAYSGLIEEFDESKVKGREA